MLQAPKNGGAGSARWSFEPPILLALPFGALVVASLRATASLPAIRFVGSALLAVLCLVSIARGVRRMREHSLPDTPKATNAGESLELCPAVTRRKSVVIGHVVPLDELQFAKPAFFRTPTYEAQYQSSAVLGTIALAALSVVAFLVAGQIQRSGPITPFAEALGCLLGVVPAALALHLALSRIDVEFTPQYVRISCKRGLLGTAVTQWSMAEVRSIQLESAAEGLAVNLVVQVNNQHRTIVLRGRAQQEAQQWFALGSGKS